MSSPPEYPGRRQLEKKVERLSGAPGGRAYEGAFEAVGAILIATLFGYWFDQHYETTPAGVLVGAGIGFAAFVLRLVRLGKQLHGDGTGETDAQPPAPEEGDASEGPGENAGLADILTEDEDETATPRKD
ncbi:MAG: AtpZ/AtpI family protein [bacterium]|nr:AtpZ/AtpI family protein [bacterium]